jgi:hypothetical protein
MPCILYVNYVHDTDLIKSESRRGAVIEELSKMEWHAPDCPYPGCFFCVMKETNPTKRRANVAKFFKELPSQNEDGQVRSACHVEWISIYLILVKGSFGDARCLPSSPRLFL